MSVTVSAVRRPLAALACILFCAPLAAQTASNQWRGAPGSATPAHGSAGITLPLGDPGGLAIYDTAAAFDAATAGLDLTVEDFSGGYTPPGAIHTCFQALSSQSDDPCYGPGDLAPGFSIRSTRGSIFHDGPGWAVVPGSAVYDSDVVEVGASVLGSAGALVGANIFDPPYDPTQVSFDGSITAVAFDAYEGQAGGMLQIIAYDAGDTEIGRFTVTPAATNVPAFVGFTSAVPVDRVTIDGVADGSGELIGNLRFGGGAGHVRVSAETLDFGVAAPGASGSASVTVTNAGDLTLYMGGSAVAQAVFSIDSDTCAGAALARGASCSIEVGFHPDAWRRFHGTLLIPGSDPAGPTLVALEGEGVQARVLAAPGNVDFGSTAIGSSSAPQAIALENLEPVPVSVTAISTLEAPFAQTGGDCASPPFDLAPGAHCTLEIGFTPSGIGTAAGALTVTTAAAGPLDIHFYGEGTEP
jgi:hypothetical protein